MPESRLRFFRHLQESTQLRYRYNVNLSEINRKTSVVSRKYLFTLTKFVNYCTIKDKEVRGRSLAGSKTFTSSYSNPNTCRY